MQNHFDHEAALMNQAGGQLCECHQREHATLLELCDRAAELAPLNWSKSRLLLRSKFPQLVRDHVNGLDQFLVLFINTQSSVARDRSA
jgi:hemerythrin